MKKKKKALYELVLSRGFARTEQEARALIMSGKILVNEIPVDKPGTAITEDAAIRVKVKKGHHYVGRGALKLDGAFEDFPVDVTDRVCADVGASTGGFTQVLLERGASRVYAIDTAYGELSYNLRADSRVVCMERTDVLKVQSLPEAIDFIAIDVSLVSLKKIIPVVAGWLSEDGHVIALFKPQYEASAGSVNSESVITSRKMVIDLLQDFVNWIQKKTVLSVHGLSPSAIKGGKGNQEFLCWCSLRNEPRLSTAEIPLIIDRQSPILAGQ